MKNFFLILAVIIGMETGAYIATLYINKIANEIQRHYDR